MATFFFSKYRETEQGFYLPGEISNKRLGTQHMQTFAFFFSIFNLNDARCIQQGARERGKTVLSLLENAFYALNLEQGLVC